MHCDIDDDVSEILIKVFLNLKKFDSSRSKFKSWVIGIAKNHMIDKWRCNTNTATQLSLDAATFTSSQNISFNSNTSTANIPNNRITALNSNYSASCNFEHCNTVTYISAQLSASDFTLLNMKYVQGYNYEEIGKEFQITSTTVSNKINYIKTKLKKNIPEDIFD